MLPFKKVDYDSYMRAVRRYGFKGKISPKVFTYILKEIKVRVPETDEKNPYYRMIFGQSMLDCDGQFSA